MILTRKGRAPERHDAVADELIDRAMLVGNRRGTREKYTDICSSSASAVDFSAWDGEVLQVGKQDGQIALFDAEG